MGKLVLASVSYKASDGVAKQIRLVHTESDDLIGEVTEGVMAYIKEHYPEMEVTGLSITSAIDLSNYINPKKERPLQRPSAYSLQECLAELKFGRPEYNQQTLDRFIRSINRVDSEKTDYQVLFEELEELQGVVPEAEQLILEFKERTKQYFDGKQPSEKKSGALFRDGTLTVYESDLRELLHKFFDRYPESSVLEVVEKERLEKLEREWAEWVVGYVSKTTDDGSEQ